MLATPMHLTKYRLNIMAIATSYPLLQVIKNWTEDTSGIEAKQMQELAYTQSHTHTDYAFIYKSITSMTMITKTSIMLPL